MENTNTQNRTKRVSIFKSHHATQILYPSRLLLKDGEAMSISYPGDAQDRFERHPVVPDAAVILNKTSGNHDLDTDFTTYNPTSLWYDDDTMSTGDLFKDMQAVTQHVGATKLRVVLYYEPAATAPGAPRKNYVRINRFTRFEFPDRKPFYDKVEYEIPYRDLPRRPTTPWEQDLFELVRMASARAVLHAQQRLAAVGGRLPEYQWKAPRTVALEKAIAHLATVMTKAELSEYNSTLPDENDHIKECPFCTEEFDDADTTDPVKLRCSKRHVLCKSCVQNICRTSGIANVRWPWCAVLLANDPNNHILKPNYLDPAAPFRNDPRYTKHENFERGCADLDAGHVRDDTTKIVISKARFDFVCEILIHTSPSPERHERYWRDHRYTAEYTIVTAAVHAFCRGWNGESWPVNEVYKQMRHMIFHCLADEWKKGEMYAYATDKLKQDVGEDLSKVPLRPGFVEFIDRSLNRLLRFMVVRRCDRDCGTLCGFHAHGERSFHKVYWATREDDVFGCIEDVLRKKRKARTWAMV
ncbi:uncharacterized protein CLAFUR5_04637 [Fulvia fulva]|uniref:RING-type domain-containing protein n=1 Tax=Passalora fulva TaxID=5499 RepID=A0A9Q8LEH1_PASFU|nr:uncharacterized protein CLAFUR5_04637 [Fulvia fulva]KAK4628631.1 hypothetical protein CLAFUR0_04666 [Fulvia fulva]UJO15904.1 hypothetical protein CLAFUR5_04637 [Fulvia fulva]WPV29294.1 hypothetical protein CLAFUW7_04670 [Fulvia fulva]